MRTACCLHDPNKLDYNRLLMYNRPTAWGCVKYCPTESNALHNSLNACSLKSSKCNSSTLLKGNDITGSLSLHKKGQGLQFTAPMDTLAFIITLRSFILTFGSNCCMCYLCKQTSSVPWNDPFIGMKSHYNWAAYEQHISVHMQLTAVLHEKTIVQRNIVQLKLVNGICGSFKPRRSGSDEALILLIVLLNCLFASTHAQNSNMGSNNYNFCRYLVEYSVADCNYVRRKL